MVLDNGNIAECCFRVMVLDNGNIAEFDSPQALLSNPKSAFYAMCKDAGIQTSSDDVGSRMASGPSPSTIPSASADIVNATDKDESS